MAENDDNGSETPSGRARTAQAVTAGLILLGIVTGIFVLQNTQDVTLTFLAWSAALPLAAGLLLAVALGAAGGFMVAYVRQRQYVKTLKRHAGKGSEQKKAA